MTQKTYTTHSSEETKQVALEFARTLKGGECVFLEGELGAGKTTFVQGLASALGVTDAVRSPTFAVMNMHSTKHPTIKTLVHLDLYRLEKPEEIRPLGLEEWLDRPDTVVIVEWPRTMWVRAKITATISFTVVSSDERKIAVQ